jgi:tripartite-type tricarboxylate transporter receptor subunit TctC
MGRSGNLICLGAKLPANREFLNFFVVLQVSRSRNCSAWAVSYSTSFEGGMQLSRRTLLYLAAGGIVLPAGLRFAGAQAYPTRLVRWIVGFPPGGGTDISARLIAHWLAERLGQPFVIENRPGANGNIGTEAVVRATPDGYTHLVVGPPAAINAALYNKLNFNFIHDIAPVAGFVRFPLVMAVNSSFPARTVPEFIAYARDNPGKINMASAGNGTAGHMAGELFKMMTGIEMAHVPYRGGAPALNDLLAGQVQVFFGFALGPIEHIRTGRLRALAVTTATRSDALPDTSTVADFVPGYEAGGWDGLGAPKNTPVEIVDKLNTEINAALADPKIKARLADLGGTALSGSPADFGKLIADETAKWGKVVKFAGIKLD